MDRIPRGLEIIFRQRKSILSLSEPEKNVATIPFLEKVKHPNPLDDRERQEDAKRLDWIWDAASFRRDSATSRTRDPRWLRPGERPALAIQVPDHSAPHVSTTPRGWSAEAGASHSSPNTPWQKTEGPFPGPHARGYSRRYPSQAARLDTDQG